MSLRGFLGSLAASALFAVPAPAIAQSEWQLPANAVHLRYADAPQAPFYEARRTAYDNGYREGARRGEEDARRGDRFHYQDERDFQRGDKGYHRSYGDRDRYRQVFRDGFASGYSDGYSRYSRLGGNTRRSGPYAQGPYRQGGYGGWGTGRYGGRYSPAFDNGVREGYEKGQEDARKNRSFDVLRHSWYRSGDRHYEREYGSRDEYKNVYRRGFQQGYERGYREGRYRW